MRADWPLWPANPLKEFAGQFVALEMRGGKGDAADRPNCASRGSRKLSCSTKPKRNCPGNVVSEKEIAMSIIGLIHIKIDPSEVERALQVWKTECAPA